MEKVRIYSSGYHTLDGSGRALHNAIVINDNMIERFMIDRKVTIKAQQESTAKFRLVTLV